MQPHIQLREGQVHPVVLTMGDPERLDLVASLCDSFSPLAHNREYRSATAEYKGGKFTVISHGVGGSGALICFEELIALGAKVIIRAGTCGSLKPEKLHTGDIFVPFAVARDPDVTDIYADPRMPAVATPRVYNQLIETGKEMGFKLHEGVGLSSGLFYVYQQEQLERLKKWAALTDAVEFELQALFLVGLARKIETGGILTVDGSPLQWDKKNYNPTGAACGEGKKQMLQVAVATCAKFSREFDSKKS